MPTETFFALKFFFPPILPILLSNVSQIFFVQAESFALFRFGEVFLPSPSFGDLIHSEVKPVPSFFWYVASIDRFLKSTVVPAFDLLFAVNF